jgi:fluoroquinolone resistance protein
LGSYLGAAALAAAWSFSRRDLAISARVASSGTAGMGGAKFGGCDLRGSDLSAVDPESAELRGAIVNVDQALVIAAALGLDVRYE